PKARCCATEISRRSLSRAPTVKHATTRREKVPCSFISCAMLRAQVQRGRNPRATSHPNTAASHYQRGKPMKKFVLLASLLASTSVFANDVDPASFEKDHFNSSL